MKGQLQEKDIWLQPRQSEQGAGDLRAAGGRHPKIEVFKPDKTSLAGAVQQCLEGVNSAEQMLFSWGGNPESPFSDPGWHLLRPAGNSRPRSAFRNPSTSSRYQKLNWKKKKERNKGKNNTLTNQKYLKTPGSLSGACKASRPRSGLGGPSPSCQFGIFLCFLRSCPWCSSSGGGLLPAGQ